MDFIYFLGRFHVLALHLPIGILILAVLMEILSRRERFRALAPALPLVWGAAAVTAIGTVILGLMHATESTFAGSAGVTPHGLAGTALALVTCAAFVLRLKFDAIYERIWPAVNGAAIALLVVVGHLGGNLTHGDTYLVEYAPGPLRALAGVSAESAPRDKPADVASADAYLDVVAPALKQRCSACHNDSKFSGSFSVASYEKTMKGGMTGAAIVPGDAIKSDLYRRITISHTSADFMPKEGKTPLTEDQVAAIGWWINAGAPKTGAVGSQKANAADLAVLSRVLDLPAPAGAAGVAGSTDAKAAPADLPPDTLPTVPEADRAAIDALEASGFSVRQVAADSNMLDIDLYGRKTVTPADLANLDKLRLQIRSLILRNGGLTDSAMPTIGGMTNLAALRLENNAISDAGAARLSGLKRLRNLNLSSTRITGRTLATLDGLPNLRTLHLWRTGVSASEAAQFAARRDGAVYVTAATDQTFAAPAAKTPGAPEPVQPKWPTP